MTGETDDQQPSALDVPRVVVELRRGAAIGKRAAELRPQRDALGEALLNLANLHELMIAVGRTGAITADLQNGTEFGWAHELSPKDRYSGDPWLPAAGSPAASDLRTLETAAWPPELIRSPGCHDGGRVLMVTRRLLEASLDHLRSIAYLFQAERSTRAPIVLARAALEASARAWFLLDPDMTPAVRFTTAINAELEALDEDKRHAPQDDDKTELIRLGREIKALIAAGKSAGLSASKDHRHRVDPYVRPSAMIDALFAGGSLHHALSAIVHSQESEGFRIMLGLAGGEVAHQVQHMALYTLPAIVTFVQAVPRLYDYTGWTVTGIPDPAEATNQVLTLWSRGAGQYDEYYFAQAEADLMADGSITTPEEAEAQIEQLRAISDSLRS